MSRQFIIIRLCLFWVPLSVLVRRSMAFFARPPPCAVLSLLSTKGTGTTRLCRLYFPYSVTTTTTTTLRNQPRRLVKCPFAPSPHFLIISNR